MITENDFKNILTALDPDEPIDYELILIIMATYYYERALDMLHKRWDQAADRYSEKGKRIMDYMQVFKKLNKE